jgi:hypothetical protein
MSNHAETSRSKHYLYYLLGILSVFVAFRSYTLEGGKTTALVWYFFPNQFIKDIK